MKYLLDVNMLVAWGWADHVDHERVARWIGARMRTPQVVLMTSAIPQLGFVRVSVQRSGGKVTAAAAGLILKGMLGALGRQHAFLPDDADALSWPDWCRGAGRTTDAHLLRLAKDHEAELVTLDQGIPGAVLVP